jgi:hypothetical protein
MRRCLWTCAKWTSTAAVAAALCLFALSLHHDSQLGGAGQFTFSTNRGCLTVNYLSDFGIISYPTDWPPGAYPRLEPRRLSWTPRYVQTTDGWYASLPTWIPLLMTSAIAAQLWIAAIRARHTKGLCHHCAYDRRGLPADANCPECGSLSSVPRPTP